MSFQRKDASVCVSSYLRLLLHLFECLCIVFLKKYYNSFQKRKTLLLGAHTL